MDENYQRKLERRASVYSIILVLFVSAVKSVMIFFTNSVSYRGEFTDSIVDIAIVALTFISLKVSQKPSDSKHMYGHYKINSFMGIIESFLTMGLYGYILYTAIIALINYSDYTVENPLISIYSLIGIVAVNIFFSTQIVRIGNKLNISVIKAQGVNFRGDLIRNIAVIGALIGAYFGVHIIDPILAILAVIYAFYESIKIIRVSFNELIDYNSVDPDRIERIKQYIQSIPEVSLVDYFAVRTAGRKLELAVRLVLKSKGDIVDSHEITHSIKNQVVDEFGDYDINSFIEIMQPSSEQLSPLNSDLFEKIRRLGDSFEILKDIHHLSIDRMEKMLLVQFHVNVNKNETLNQIHSIVTELESKMKNTLLEDYPDVPIEILSHIEPTNKLDFSITTHRSLDSDIIDEHVKKAIAKLPDIINYKIINLLEEANGIFLSIIIYIDGEISIFKAHLTAESLEIHLKQMIPEIYNCIIHTEPGKS